MSSSLGFRRACEYSAGRPPPITPVETEHAAPAPVAWCTCGVFKGFIPLLFFSCLAATVPGYSLYVDLDLDSDLTRGLIVGGSALVATAVVVANHCATWYNMTLFFHTAIEVRVLDVVITYALAESTEMTGQALAWTGVIVNTSLAIYIDTSLLVLVLWSSLAFLLVALFTFGSECKTPSLASQLRQAISGGKLITCEPFVV